MNILVIEDEKNLADAIVRILTDAHYHAEAVYDGKSGLISCQSGLYDAAIVDRMLPGMDGLDIVKEVRRSGDSMPILILTARTSTQDKVDGLDAGADDYLTKPLKLPNCLLVYARLLVGKEM